MKNALSDLVLKKIRDLSGLRVAEYDHEKLHSLIEGRINNLRLKDVEGYLDYLARSSDISSDRQMLSGILTTGETFFMRDPGQMELIRREILPQIIAKNHLSKHIRLWAPACSTGEEVYSLVILLERVLPEYDGWKIDVIGSDINPQFIHQANAAVYKDWSFRECSPEFKETYFERVGEGWKLIDRIKSRARFLVFDLVNGNLPDVARGLFDIDLILCRNLFIYMNFEAINQITDKLSSCLVPGGVLMTAHGELHAYRQSGLRVKIYPESLVYISQEQPNPFISNELQHSAQTTTLTKATPELKAPLRPSAAVVKPKTVSELLKTAWNLADSGHFSEALIIYREIMSRDSMCAELYYLHAVILMETGDIEGAKDDLRRTLYLDPNFIQAYIDLITIQIQAGKKDMAAKFCEQALRALEAVPADSPMPNLRNSTVSDAKQYLVHLQNSLT